MKVMMDEMMSIAAAAYAQRRGALFATGSGVFCIW